MCFTVDDLSKRITEFQVGEDGDGKILGAIGLQIAEKQGLIHSEAFDDFAHAEQLRPMIWERFNALANNHGLLRLWTREQAPFWSRCGMGNPDAEAMQKLPKIWQGPTTGWLTIKLRDELEALLSADKEFEIFMRTEKARTQRTLEQAKLMKLIATVIALVVVGIAAFGIVMLVRKNPHILPH